MQLQSLLPAALGGALIGLSALGLLFLHGKVAGISGMLYGLVKPEPREVRWRLTFLLGMVAVGAIAAFVAPQQVTHDVERSFPAIVLAGLLVGFGTRLGGGCTSGHVICGVGAFSKRSLVAMLTFMGVGTLTVFLVQTFFGGVL